MEVPHREPPAAAMTTETVKEVALKCAPDPKDVAVSWENKTAGVMVYKLKTNKKVFVPLKG